jgi:uncharacterized protein (DUF1330 family)
MVYAVLTAISIDDAEMLQPYIAQVRDVVSQYGGSYLAIDDKPVTVEGQWRFARTVIMTFPNMQTAQKWYQSPEYRAILPMRLQAMQANLVFVRGLEETTKTK